MTTLSPQDLELAKKHGATIENFHGDKGLVTFTRGELAAFLAERDAQQGEAVTKLEDKIERQDEALHQISMWCKAYPVKVFPKPTKEDWKRANELLAVGGMSTDALAADCMRHVLDGIQKIIDTQLANRKGE